MLDLDYYLSLYEIENAPENDIRLLQIARIHEILKRINFNIAGQHFRLS